MKVGILTIATGKYIQFVEPLWTSILQNFLPGMDKTFFLWTDNLDLKSNGVHNLVTTHIERGGFPKDTLYRYHYFLMRDRELMSCDLLFYFDADMLVMDKVSADGDLAPLIQGDVKFAFTMHPGFSWNGQIGTFESRVESTAYVSPLRRRRDPYIAGGFNGGQSEAWLEMSTHLQRAIDHDAAMGITAVWHDESHLNAWNAEELMGVNRIILHPGYCYPEPWAIPFHNYIMALGKDHKEFRDE